jgi:hypothetical protein
MFTVAALVNELIIELVCELGGEVDDLSLTKEWVVA